MAKQAAAVSVKRIPLAYLIGMGILLIDQITKYLVAVNLPLTLSPRYWYPYGGVGVFENFLGIQFSINHITNRGAAWGLFANFHDLLFWSRVVLIGGLIVYWAFYNTRREWQLPLVLIIAGALGNIIDVFLYGHVIDMFHFVFWGFDYPVFNVADASICIGIGWMLLTSLFEPSKKPKKKKKR